MLLILMYHRVSNTGFPIGDNALARHFSWLKDNFQIVTPGEKGGSRKTAVCLTFDDAYFDFYHQVFPLLKEFNFPAVLAVPTKFIIESTACSEQQRLNVPYQRTMQKQVYVDETPFCTWQELAVMSHSGLVKMASHSHQHTNLTHCQDLALEVVQSKELLESKLGQKIDTFIYPYGQMSRELQRIVSQHYRYSMRIGSALNLNWGKPGQVLYRIDAEHFWPQAQKLGYRDYLNFTLKYAANRLRGR